MGLWKELGSGPRGSIFHFAWRSDCVEAVQLVPSKVPLLGVTHKSFCKLGPCYASHTAAVTGDDHCVVTEQRVTPLRGWATAEAAAAVAAGGSGGKHGGMLGSSPPNSFGYELLKFMHGNVQKVSGWL